MADSDTIQVRIPDDETGGKDSSRELQEAKASAAQAIAAADAATRERDYWLAAKVRREQLDEARMTVRSEAGAAEAEYRQALESGNADLAAQATRRMTTATAVELELEKQRQQIISAASQPVQPADPVERYVRGRPAQTQQWLREHREYVTDPAKNRELQKAHFHAIGSNLTPDSDAYLRHVEKRIGLNGKATSRPDFNPGDVSTHFSKDGNSIQLTAGEAARARDGSIVWGRHDLAAGRIKDPNLVGRPIGAVEAAKRKLAMYREGRYNRLD